MDFEEVQPDEFTRDVGADQVLVACVPVSQGSATIKFLAQQAPMPQDLLHLKRVRKRNHELQVIVGRFQEAPDDVKAFLGTISADVQTELVTVPKYPPLTREQLASAMQVWPVTYNKPSRTPLELDDTTVSRYRCFLDAAHAAATEGNGCVFVFNDRIIARAGCSTSTHPLHHSVMRCIELVAAQMRADKERERVGDTSAPPQEDAPLEDAPLATRKRSAPDNRDDALRVRKVPSSLEGTDPELAYLCTDCEVFCVREPCVMCSMALVHSRIRLCVYDERHPTFGGLGSKMTLHTVKDLNHRFRVVRTKK